MLYTQTGGAFEGVVDDVVSPFGYKRGEGIDAGFGEHDWICNRDRARTDPLFEALAPIDGKISGAGKFEIGYRCSSITHRKLHNLFLLFIWCAAAKSELIKSKLPNSVLSKIWKLADYNADGEYFDFESNIHWFN